MYCLIICLFNLKNSYINKYVIYKRQIIIYTIKMIECNS